jgi:hypothetical protein
MSKKPYKNKVLAKTVDQGGGAYITFHEDLELPGLVGADFRIEFEEGNSFEEVNDLVRLLNKKGMVLVVQR